MPIAAARDPRDPPRSRMAQRSPGAQRDLEPINVCSLRRAAVVLVLKNKAEVLERAVKLRNDLGPRVPARDPARLLRAGAAPRGAEDLAPRRLRARRLPVPVLRLPGSHLTMDHLVPRSPQRPLVVGQRRHLLCPVQLRKGRPSSWEIGMHPRSRPRAPRPTSSSRSRPRGSQVLAAVPRARLIRPRQDRRGRRRTPPRVTVVKISRAPFAASACA